jgi:hypothetical protein
MTYDQFMRYTCRQNKLRVQHKSIAQGGESLSARHEFDY